MSRMLTIAGIVVAFAAGAGAMWVAASNELLPAGAMHAGSRGSHHGGALNATHARGLGSGSHAGKQHRDISSLSARDVAALRAGAGWGFALPAELNGYPGPKHVLELDDALGLTGEQRDAVQRIFDAMQRAAIVRGEEFLTAEQALTAAFRDKTIPAAALERLTREAAAQRGALRAVHLAAHLETFAVLTREQIATYNAQRGYIAAALDASHFEPNRRGAQQ
ncbi:MAG: Spy/CpxP family protein refolding chaperone [Pseudomonadota bacterium]